jgi:hypothetical protein
MKQAVLNLHPSRRRFIAGGMGAGFCFLCGNTRGEHFELDFNALCGQLGWNGRAPGNFYFVHATDLHANEIERGALKMPDKFGGRNFADDIATLAPRPAFAVLTGDLCGHTTRSPATWAETERGFRRVQDKILSRLADIPCHLILGNNDCSPETFKKVWPERPLHWSFDHMGVHFVGINGYNLWRPENSNHAGIVLDEAQLAWLADDLSASNASTLVLFTHEPLADADCHLIRKQLKPILDKFQGKIWNVAGHNHMNAATSIRLGEKTIRVIQTITPVGSWTPDKGAYRIVFLSHGEIIGTALRWLTKDGAPLGVAKDAGENEVLSRATSLVEDVLGTEALEVFMVGTGDVPLRIRAERTEDRISNLRLRPGGAVTYRVPLTDITRQARHLAVASGEKLSVEFSDNGQDWLPMEKSDTSRGRVLFDLENENKSKTVLFLRFSAPPEHEQKVYGFSLSR